MGYWAWRSRSHNWWSCYSWIRCPILESFFESVDVPTQIQHAADAAAKADIALVFTGRTNEFEPEGYDRETMDLTADQYKLISAVSAQNRNTVIVNCSRSPVNMVTFVDDVAAILQCSFPGQEAGHSIARVLTGQTNPCGCRCLFRKLAYRWQWYYSVRWRDLWWVQALRLTWCKSAFISIRIRIPMERKSNY